MLLMTPDTLQDERKDKHFLALEPNVDDAFLIKRALVKFCSVFVCRNIGEARAYLNGAGQYSDRLNNPFPDGVITELRLGTESGLEFIEYVRTTPELSRLPIVVLHGGSSPNAIEAARRFGVKSVFCKPSEIAELKSILATIANDLCAFD